MPAVLVTFSSLYSHLSDVPIFTCCVGNSIYLYPLHEDRDKPNNITESDLNLKKKKL